MGTLWFGKIQTALYQRINRLRRTIVNLKLYMDSNKSISGWRLIRQLYEINLRLGKYIRLFVYRGFQSNFF